MTSRSGPQPRVGRASKEQVRERPGGPTQDELLDEALKETFPASDPTSVYRLEIDRTTIDSSNDYVEKRGLPLVRHRQF